MAPAVPQCPVFELSREDFRRPFAQFVTELFAKNPGIAMLKVRPPKGWRPWLEDPPGDWLDEMEIQTPIKQHAFGTRGTYRCMHIEQKPMKVKDFRDIAEMEDHLPPKKGHEDDTLLERSFWSSITINPPLYGADNPMSLFDKKIRVGWNLRDLGDLLQTPGLPQIPGVTTPMVYFGMWKSYFGWHVEDCDLYSINYMHFGAPKVWYCVSPADRAKFESMARQEFPELYNNCKGFLRHKDIMFSPSMLRTHNVPYIQAKQEPGEFMVIRAAAYHAGFNMGFNCAEAVNFALPDWLSIGRKTVSCKCDALKDAVQIDMRFFIPDLTDSESDSDYEESGASDKEDEVVELPPAKRGRGRPKGSKNKPKDGTAKSAEGSKPGPGRLPKQQATQAKRGPGRPRKGVDPGSPGRNTAVANEADGSSQRERSDTRARKVLGVKAGSGTRKATDAKGVRRITGAPLRVVRNRSPPLPSFLAAAAQGEAAAERLTATSAEALGRRSLRSTVPVLPKQQGDLLSHDQRPLAPQLPAKRQQLVAIIGEGSRGHQDRFFYICAELPAGNLDSAKGLSGWRTPTEGEVNLLWLKEGSDGLFRPTNIVWQERRDSLVKVRSQFNKAEGAYKLMTLRSRILDTELVD